RTDHAVASGHSHSAALLSGYHLAFAIGAALVVVSLIVAIVVLKPERVAAAEHAIEAEAVYADGATIAVRRRHSQKKGLAHVRRSQGPRQALLRGGQRRQSGRDRRRSRR